MRKHISKLSPPRGNALFLILIAVALFAALSYAITQSGRGGGNISKEQAALRAAELVQYLNKHYMAVQRLLITGCDITEINFAGAPGSSNGGSPADGSCDLYDANGGGLTYTEPPSYMFDDSFSSYAEFGQVRYERNNNLQLDDGTTNAYGVELVVPFLNEEICLEINKQLGGVSNIPIDSDNAVDGFAYVGTPVQGGYDDCETTDYANSACGGYTGCYYVYSTWPTLSPPSGTSSYVAYQVIMKQN